MDDDGGVHITSPSTVIKSTRETWSEQCLRWPVSVVTDPPNKNNNKNTIFNGMIDGPCVILGVHEPWLIIPLF